MGQLRALHQPSGLSAPLLAPRTRMRPGAQGTETKEERGHSGCLASTCYLLRAGNDQRSPLPVPSSWPRLSQEG